MCKFIGLKGIFMKLLWVSLFLFCLPVFAREWAAHEVSLRSQIDKIREKEKKIGELIHLKNETKEDAKLKPLLAEIKKEYGDLEKFYKELEEEKRHVRFEHPDQGMDVERKYRAFKIRTIEDMENEIGTEGRLSRLKSKVLKKYGVEPTPAQEPVVEEPKKEEPVEKHDEKPKGKERPKLSM
jgi:hypothetical protein